MHPRFIFFPWQKDYAAQGNVFCLYAMTVAEKNYRSASLNTDQLGFRVQYDFNGDVLNLLQLKEKYNSCTVLLGNSTSFGVSLSSDRKAMGCLLSEPDRPCINLSVRGATMQQELALFQTFKHLLPPIAEIYLFTGICDVSLATQGVDYYSDAVGALNNQNYFRRKFLEIPEIDDLANLARLRFLRLAERLYARSSILQWLFESKKSVPQERATQLTAASFEAKLPVSLDLTRNVMETWGWISKATGIKVTFFLQPVLGWTDKPLTRVERMCTSADAKRVPAIAYYANRPVYQKISRHFQQACVDYGLAFQDANIYFDSITTNQGALFSDICHLTDEGASAVVRWMRGRLRT